MFVIRYKIEHFNESEQTQDNRWRIELEMQPTWFERTFMGTIFNKKTTLEGSYLTWHWADSGKTANIFWSVWADCAVRKHLKDNGKSYVFRNTHRP